MRLENLRSVIREILIKEKIDTLFSNSPDQDQQSIPAEKSSSHPTAAAISTAYPMMSSYANEIILVSEEIGIDPKWLANVINFESKGGDPKAVNNTSNATGIIQFMPKTAAKLGTSTSTLYGMTGKEQMKYVQKYFEPYRGRLKSQEDVYMAVFYPKAIGQPDYKFPPMVVKSNPGIETPRDYAQKANKNAKLR